MDSNSIIAIATVILVIITGIYAYLTNKILKSSENATQENFRPHVLAFFISKNGALHIVFENYGNRPALNAVAIFAPSLDERLFHEKLKESAKLFSQSVLMPKQSLESAIGFNAELLHKKDFQDICFKYEVAVTYNDLEGKNYQSKYPLDIKSFYFQGKTGFYEQKYYLKGIYDEIHDIKVIMEDKL